MKSWPKCIILSFLLSLWCNLVLAQEELPFWRTNHNLYKRITQQRKVVVSVKIETEGNERKIRMLGVGAVNVPIYFAVEQVMQFEELPKVSGYFKKVVHKRDKKEVYFHIEALGSQIRFVKTYKWGVQKPDEAQMDWFVTWGPLKGMAGHYKFRAITPVKTEVAIWASLRKLNLPLPQFLVNFTLEVIAEKTAQKMRSFMEDKYRNARKVREEYVKKR